MGSLTRGKYTFGNRGKQAIMDLTAGITMTGTLYGASGATSFTGSGTQFLTELKVGDPIFSLTTTQGLVVASISSNTALTVHVAPSPEITGEAYKLYNPQRIQRGETVFNTDANMPMYFTGNGTDAPTWGKGEFVGGQMTPVRNAYFSQTILEGTVLEPGLVTGMLRYNGTYDEALGVAYHDVIGGYCIPVCVVGIHTIASTGTITKGHFFMPHTGSSGAATAAVQDGGTTRTTKLAGVACTDNGTPGTNQIKGTINFTERL